MSRGPGHVQRAIIAAFAAQPNKAFSTAQLAELVYPDQTIGKCQIDAVDRAVRKLAPQLDLKRLRSRPWKAPGWFNVWARADRMVPNLSALMSEIA